MITKVDHAVSAVGASSKPKRVLDVGCGVGTLSLPLASCGHQIVAVDVDEESIEYCRGKAAKLGLANIDFRAGLLQDVVEAKNDFDWVVLADVLEHIDKPAEFLQALKSYLKPDGRLWISIPNESTSLAQFVPTFQVATAIKLLVAKAAPRTLKSKLRGIRHGTTPVPPSKGSASRTREFRPLYFNYSLNDHSPHVQQFTFQTIQETVIDGGYIVQRVDAGSLFYKMWPLHKIMDKLTLLAHLDHRLAQLVRRVAGNWWLVARM